MKMLFKGLLPVFMYLLAQLLTIQAVHGQSPLHDSLRSHLTYFEENAKDPDLKQAVKEAQALATVSSIDSLLWEKLFEVEDLLANTLQIDHQRIVSYANLLLKLSASPNTKVVHPFYIRSLSKKAYLLEQIGDYNDALQLLEKVLVLKENLKGKEHSDYAESLDDLGKLYERMGEYHKAVSVVNQSLEIKRKTVGEEDAAYAESLTTLFIILYQDMGQYEQALPLVLQALRIRKKVFGEEDAIYAESLNNLAGLYESIGDYGKALPLYLQEVAIMKKAVGEDHPDYSYSLNDLAYLYEDMGQYLKSIPLYLQALDIRKKSLGEEHPYYAISLNNLAHAYWAMGNFKQALPLAETALQIRKKELGEENVDYAISLISLARLHTEMHNYDTAKSLCNKALLIRKKVIGTEDVYYAIGLNNLAYLYELQGEEEQALQSYEQVLTIREKLLGTEHPDYSGTLNDLGRLYSILNKKTMASSAFIKATVTDLKHLYRTFFSLSEQEKMIFTEKKADQFSYIPSLIYLQGYDERNILNHLYQNELALKGMILEDQQTILNEIRKSKEIKSIRLYDQWRSNKAFLGKQLLLPVAERVSYFDSLNEATNRQEQELSLISGTFKNTQSAHAVTTKNISEKLKKNQAAVEFIRFNLFDKKWTDSIMYAALVLLPEDSIPHFIPLCEEKQLVRLLMSSSTASADYSAIQKLYPGKKNSKDDSLYQLIWKPLEKYLTNIHTVYYAPAGLLHRIAFQALRADSTHLLIEKYGLNQVLSTRSVALTTPVKPPLTASLWGHIKYNTSTNALVSRGSNTKSRGNHSFASLPDATSTFDFYTSDTRASRGREWGPLPATKNEVDQLKLILRHSGIRTTITTGNVATEEAFKKLDGKSPQVLHIATHGFFLPVAGNTPTINSEFSDNAFTVQQNPMFRSGLVLAGGNRAWKGAQVEPEKEDGILTAYEIAQMDLSNTNLVVLSACETALGDIQGNEGVIGLQRAFKMAGVKQIIMSLWQVPDKQTMQLMNLFYKNWLGGQTTRQALRNAQLKLKETYPPYYWAAFVLVE